MEGNNSILIIGAPKSGKTTFLAQLTFRIQANKSRLKLTRAIRDITPLKNARERLAKGLETESTPAPVNVQIEIPILNGEEELTLVFHDYGGEQVRDITEFLEYDKLWMDRTRQHDRWVLFIRASEIYHPYDLSQAGYVEPEVGGDGDPSKLRPSHQYKFIELLQALLHARGIGLKGRVEGPKLMIVLTCWDELSHAGLPSDTLKSKMPLFFEFVRSNWAENSWGVIGLSAQGFELGTQDARDKYLDELPESHGYVILPDGKEDPDLTRVIEMAIDL